MVTKAEMHFSGWENYDIPVYYQSALEAALYNNNVTKSNEMNSSLFQLFAIPSEKHNFPTLTNVDVTVPW